MPRSQAMVQTSRVPMGQEIIPYQAPAAGPKPKGSLLGKIGKGVGGGLTAFMLYQMIKGGMERGRKSQAARMLPVDSPNQVLAKMAREETMAGREARLMRADPEAYQLLQGAMGQDNGPALATGEFAVGSSGGRQVGPAEMEELLRALRGE